LTAGNLLYFAFRAPAGRFLPSAACADFYINWRKNPKKAKIFISNFRFFSHLFSLNFAANP